MAAFVHYTIQTALTVALVAWLSVLVSPTDPGLAWFSIALVAAGYLVGLATGLYIRRARRP